ncbi:MFS family permease [Actinokineospora baliensis]|uniref:MFS transporter n=1 Tax=Actinokineospora baliensis TaxID=547056 RepID=UPI0019571D25|nr:MFS transporter [Actinokineospora baliensis]MBM7775512.1 MFS family permease [Actinokineospora baliensis]
MRNPSTLRILLGLVFTRLATPVLSLALLLAAADKYGSYATAGGVIATHGIAQALCAAVAGRLVDRGHSGRVLTGFLLAQTCAYAALLVLLSTPVPPSAVIAGAAAMGLTTPPVSAVLRSAWPRLVAEGDLRTAYAADNMTNELMYVAGPPLVALSLEVVSATLAIGVAGTAQVLGCLILLRSPDPARGHMFRRPDAALPPPKGWAAVAGPLSHGPTAAVLAVTVLTSAAFGALRLSVVAACAAFAYPDASGYVLGLMSVGALAGAFLFGSRQWRINDQRLLFALCLTGGVLYLITGQVSSVYLVAGLVAVIGLVDGMRTGLQQVMISDRAPDHWRAETFSWLNSLMWVGYALGSALAGRLVSPAGAVGAFTAAAAVLGVASLVALTIRALRDREFV